MKAWVVKQWCEPEEMGFEELPTPAPGANQVRVKVEAAALNFLDTLIIRGQYQVKPPFLFTPGVEVAGIVEAAGAGSPWRPGARVCGNLGTGGYATHAILDDAAVAPVPGHLELRRGFRAADRLSDGAPLPARDAGRMQAGETVLVHAGAGGVGLAALQLAKVWGAGKIIATAGGAEKLAVCKAHGADFAFDYSTDAGVDQVKEATGGRGADIIVDMVGGKVAEKLDAPPGLARAFYRRRIRRRRRFPACPPTAFCSRPPPPSACSGAKPRGVNHQTLAKAVFKRFALFSPWWCGCSWFTTQL